MCRCGNVIPISDLQGNEVFHSFNGLLVLQHGCSIQLSPFQVCFHCAPCMAIEMGDIVTVD